jgi:hypothetical protein
MTQKESFEIDYIPYTFTLALIIFKKNCVIALKYLRNDQTYVTKCGGGVA